MAGLGGWGRSQGRLEGREEGQGCGRRLTAEGRKGGVDGTLAAGSLLRGKRGVVGPVETALRRQHSNVSAEVRWRPTGQGAGRRVKGVRLREPPGAPGPAGRGAAWGCPRAAGPPARLDQAGARAGGAGTRAELQASRGRALCAAGAAMGHLWLWGTCGLWGLLLSIAEPHTGNSVGAPGRQAGEVGVDAPGVRVEAAPGSSLGQA